MATDGVRHNWTSYSQTLLHAVVRSDILGGLRRVEVPTVIVFGRDDPVASVSLRDPAVISQFSSAVDVIEVDGNHHIPLTYPTPPQPPWLGCEHQATR